MPARALILDYDGLMIDTEGPVFEAWRELYHLHGAELTVRDWLGALGYVDGFNVRRTLEERAGRDDFDWPAIQASVSRRVLELLAGYGPLPGVVELICDAIAAGWRLGVASNSTVDWVVPGLERLGLRGMFQAIRTRETVQHPKPEPDIYLAVLRDLGAEPCDAIACEDSQPGVESAKAAGLYVAGVPGAMTMRQDLSKADEIFGSLLDFRPKFRAIVERGQTDARGDFMPVEKHP